MSGAVLWALMQLLLLRSRKRQFTVWPRVLETERLFGGNLTFAYKSRMFPYFGCGEWPLSPWSTARNTVTFTLVKQRRTVPPHVHSGLLTMGLAPDGPSLLVLL